MQVRWHSEQTRGGRPQRRSNMDRSQHSADTKTQQAKRALRATQGRQWSGARVHKAGEMRTLMCAYEGAATKGGMYMTNQRGAPGAAGPRGHTGRAADVASRTSPRTSASAPGRALRPPPPVHGGCGAPRLRPLRLRLVADTRHSLQRCSLAVRERCGVGSGCAAPEWSSVV